MNKLIIVLMLMSSNAFAVTPEQCAAKGKSFVRATVTKNGNFRRNYCRRGRAKLTKAQRIAKLNALRVKHPEMVEIIENKINQVSNEN